MYVRGRGVAAKPLNNSSFEASTSHEVASSPEPAADPESDIGLVQRAQQGDSRAFEALFIRYRGRAYAVAIGILKNPEDAMDVVQEAFIKVHRHLPRFEGASSFYTWLYRIVVNLGIDNLRRRRRAPSVSFDDHMQKYPESIAESAHAGAGPSSPEPPSARTEQAELRTKLEAALAELPPHHRAVIVLREIEGMSYEQIAQTLDVPRGTVMSRLFHARRKLQTALAPYLEVEP